MGWLLMNEHLGNGLNRRLGLFASLSMLLLMGCGEEAAPEKTVVRPVKAMRVSDVEGFRQRQFPGRAKGTQEVDLAFRVSGPLITRLVGWPEHFGQSSCDGGALDLQPHRPNSLQFQ